jgi:hypothetical protein
VRRGRTAATLALCIGVPLALAASSAAFLAAHALFGRTAARIFGAAAALAGCVCLAQVVLRSGVRQGNRVESRWLAAGFFICLASYSAMFVAQNLTDPDGGEDAWITWNLGARFLLRGGTVAAATSPALHPWHPEVACYPLLLQGLVAQSWLLAGSENAAIPAILAGTFALAATGTVVCGLAVLERPSVGYLAGIALLCTPAFLELSANQYADAPVAAFLAVACVLVAVAFASDSAAAMVAAGTAASAAAATKNEGLLYVLALLAALAFVGKEPESRWSRWKRAGWFAAGALPGIALLAACKWWLCASAGALSLTDAVVRSLDARRAATVALLLLRRVVYFQQWGLFLVAEVAAVIWLCYRPERHAAARTIGTALGLSLLAFALVYLGTPYEVTWHLRTSIDRLLVQCWPSALFATFLAVDSDR